MPVAYTGQSRKIQFAEEAAFGTAIGDAIAANQMICAAAPFNFDTQHRSRDTANGQRIQDEADVANDRKGAIPNFALTTDGYHDELDYWLYAFFQNVSEEVTTPFKKTFTLVSPGADFSTNEGIWFTFWNKAELASHSDQFVSCLLKSLNLKCAPDSDDARLVATLNMQSFHPSLASRIANPSGTLTRPAQEFWQWHDLDRFKLNDIDIVPRAFELNFDKLLVWTGQDTNSDAENVAQVKFMITGRSEILWNAAAQTVLADFDAGTARALNIGWGNATPGTVDGDLDFALNIIYTGGLKDHGEVEYVNLEFKVVSDLAGSIAAATIILANANDRTWPGP